MFDPENHFEPRKEPMMGLPDTTTNVSPTVARIVTTLTDRIHSGFYPAGEWLPSERDLASDFNVSRILVRSALKELERQDLLVCAANRRPIVSRSINLARPTARARRSLAAWIWPNAIWPPTGMILRGIQESLGSEFRLVLGSPVGVTWEENYASEGRFLQQVCEDRDIEGLILGYMGGQSNLAALEAVRAANVALVFLDHLPPTSFHADYVGVNNRYGTEQAAKYLISIGHRSIAYVANYDTLSTVEERLAGYRRALSSAGIEYRETLVERDPGPTGNDPEQGCEQLVERLLGLPEPPTAICAVNDVVALRVIAALRSLNVRVPDDISVIGFDGVERWGPTQPFLTTVQQPFQRIGEQAIELLLERIKYGPSTPYKHAILDVELAVHRSTRPYAPFTAATHRNHRAGVVEG
jgi:DNA-binding LacI/PurR family transcriptional regulator